MGRYSKLPKPPILPLVTPLPPTPFAPAAVPRIHSAARRLGPELVGQLIADYEAGAASTALMVKYRIGKGTVLNILEQHGVARRNQPLTPEQCAEAIDLYLSGWSMAKVGRRYGRAHTVIRDMLKRHNVSRSKS